MIIDTVQLKKAVEIYFTKEAVKADSIKNDERAMRVLTKLEEQEEQQKSLIEAVELLNKGYECIDGFPKGGE